MGKYDNWPGSQGTSQDKFANRYNNWPGSQGTSQDKFANRYNNWPGTGVNAPGPKPGAAPAPANPKLPTLNFGPLTGAVDEWMSAGAQPVPGAPAPPPPLGQLETPGAGEQAWAQYGNAFWQPWEAEKAYQGLDWQSLMQQSQNMPTYNADAYNQFKVGPASMSGYYDRAWDTGSERLNKEFASRGAYNSGAAVEQLSDLAGNLGAQQARDEAQYALDRARTGSMLAQAAFGESRSALGDQMSVLQGQLGSAMDADRAKLLRLSGGLSGAFMSQGAEEGRLRGGVEDVLNGANAAAVLFSSGALGALAADEEFLAKSYEAKLAQLQADYNMNKEQADNFLGLLGLGVQAAGVATQAK